MHQKKKKKQPHQKKNNYYGFRILDFIFKKVQALHSITQTHHFKTSTALKYFIINKQVKPYQVKLFLKQTIWRRRRNSKLKTRFFKNPIFNSESRIVYNKIKIFQHKHFISSKVFFNQNSVPLVGKSPSLFYGDLRPIKYWKITQALVDKNIIKTRIGLNSSRRFFKNRFKRNRYKQKSRWRYKFAKKYNLKFSLIQHLRTKKRPNKNHIFLKRSPAPVNTIRWKMSNPLMFTNNIQPNRELKPKIDLTLKRFLKKNTNRRYRRFAKMVFLRFKSKRRVLKKKNKTQPKLTPFTKKKYSLILHKIIKKHKRILHNKTVVFKISCNKSKKLVPKTLKANFFKARLAIKPIKYLKKKRISIIDRCRRSIQPSPCHISTNHLLKNLVSKLKETIISKTNTTTHKIRTLLNLVNTDCTLTPRTAKNFIFKNIGMFLHHYTITSRHKPFNYKYFFKKKIFSFLYPNEVRNSLMNRKKKIIFYKLVFKINHKSKKKIFYNVAEFNKFFLKHYKIHLYNQTSSAEFGNLNTLFNARPNYHKSSFNLNYLNYTQSVDEILYEENFSHRGTDLSFRFSEVKIPRIRFKPGYQRMWRNARLALQELMDLKFIYQQQLTKYLVKFYKTSNYYNFSKTEMSLNRMIMYARLLPDNPTVNLFFEQKLIYLNGRITPNITTLLQTNDLIQLIISIWYYVAFRWISNWTLKRHKKFKKLVYRKGLASRHKVMKLKKQRSYYTPNWIYLARYDISDVKPYLEVDYFTLSAFVIYEPFFTYYYAPDEFPDYRPNIYRMYNWKYIT